eukprot:TRINITY_DN18835_c0_g1_i1.p1 TRINITY_DN18835_c0_g1~~TRINITY_DN18835_c0_g1_i1.p1  ORF type:complete len:377 (-),score=85.06 TRINITY_DN18835_c0_g1_i1:93-1181(-)
MKKKTKKSAPELAVGEGASTSVKDSPDDSLTKSLESAAGVDSLKAALEAAKAQGLSNRHSAVKAAKRKLFALTAGVEFDSLPSESPRYAKRKLGGATPADSGVDAPGESSKKEKKRRRKAEGELNASVEDAPQAPEAKKAKDVPVVKDAEPEKATEFKIFVGGLSTVHDAEQVKKIFAACGEIATFYMPCYTKAKRKGEPKGYALISYSSRAGMKAALGWNGKDLEGKPLVVERKREKEGTEDPQAAKVDKEFEVFVGGVYSIPKKQIRKHFAACGEITSFEMPLTPKGQSKGIAFIAFKSSSGMEKALELDGEEFHSKTLTVQRKLAKKDRAAKPSAGKAGESGEKRTVAGRASRAETLAG